MKFEPNPELDETRQAYKSEYDATFIKRWFFKRDTEGYHELTRKLRFMEHRTAAFIAKNHLYFSRKRYHLFEMMENHGIFGDKPGTDKHEEGIEHSRSGSLPKKIFKHRFCVECQKAFIWYEHVPSEMCKKCRSIQPCSMAELTEVR